MADTTRALDEGRTSFDTGGLHLQARVYLAAAGQVPRAAEGEQGSPEPEVRGASHCRQCILGKNKLGTCLKSSIADSKPTS